MKRVFPVLRARAAACGALVGVEEARPRAAVAGEIGATQQCGQLRVIEVDCAAQRLAVAIAHHVHGVRGDLHIGGVVTAHRHEPNRSADASGAQQPRIRGITDQHGHAAGFHRGDAAARRVGLDRDDAFAVGREGLGQACADVAEAAHHRVVARVLQAQAAELVGEHEGGGLQHGAERHRRGEKAGDLKSPVQHGVGAVVLQRDELEDEVTDVEVGVSEAAVVGLLTEAAGGEHEQHDPQRGDGEPSGARVRPETPHHGPRSTRIISTRTS